MFLMIFEPDLSLLLEVHPILAGSVTRISEFKKNPLAVIKQGV